MPSSWANVRFFLQTFPVVKEDEVGPGLPAHVGEVVGAEVRGEEHRGGSGGAAAALRFPGRWAGPCPLTEGRKEIVPARRRQRTSRWGP